MSDRLPATIELCQRAFNNGVCLGVIYRPQPDVSVCSRCSSHEAGVIYQRTDLPRGASAGSGNTTVSLR